MPRKLFRWRTRGDVRLRGCRAVLEALDDLGGELDQMRRRKDELEREVANLTQAVEQGAVSARSAT